MALFHSSTHILLSCFHQRHLTKFSCSGRDGEEQGAALPVLSCWLEITPNQLLHPDLRVFGPFVFIHSTRMPHAEEKLWDQILVQKAFISLQRGTSLEVLYHFWAAWARRDSYTAVGMKKWAGKRALKSIRAQFSSPLFHITQHQPHLFHCCLITHGATVRIKKDCESNMSMSSSIFSTTDCNSPLLPHGKLELGLILIVGSWKVCLHFALDVCGKSQLTASCLRGS